MYLTDLTFVADGNQDKIGPHKLLNYRKRELEYDVIVQVLKFQSRSYNLKLVRNWWEASFSSNANTLEPRCNSRARAGAQDYATHSKHSHPHGERDVQGIIGLRATKASLWIQGRTFGFEMTSRAHRAAVCAMLR